MLARLVAHLGRTQTRPLMHQVSRVVPVEARWSVRLGTTVDGAAAPVGGTLVRGMVALECASLMGVELARRRGMLYDAATWSTISRSWSMSFGGFECDLTYVSSRQLHRNLNALEASRSGLPVEQPFLCGR